MKPMSRKNYLRLFVKALALVMFSLQNLTLYASVRVIDAEYGLPLPQASVFDKNGMFIAVTDDDGVVPESITAESYPLNIRYIGFNPVTVETPGTETVSMEESAYSLPELVVDDVSRNIVYIQAYVREYTTFDNSKDTLAIFKEQIVDYAIPVGKSKFKGWKKPRILDQKAYEYVKIEKKKTSVDTLMYQDNGKFRATNFNIDQKFSVPERVLSGEANVDVKQGKYYPAERWSVVGDHLIYEKDDLADHQNHAYSPNALKVLGMTTNKTLAEHKFKFDKGDKKGVGVENLVEASENHEMAIKGKLVKKATEQNDDTKVSFFSEMFVIDRAYLTADEAKELKKKAPGTNIFSFQVPEGIPAPPAELVKLKASALKAAGK